MFLKSKKDAFSIVIFCATLISMITCSMLAIKFSSIYYILIGAGIGLIVYLIGLLFSAKANLQNKGDK